MGFSLFRLLVLFVYIDRDLFTGAQSYCTSIPLETIAILGDCNMDNTDSQVPMDVHVSDNDSQMDVDAQTLESQADTMESESAQPEGQADTMESESAQPEGQADKMESESAQPEGQADTMESESAQPEGQTDKTESESAQPEGQADKIESESAQPEGQTDKTESESAQPEGQTDKTESESTQPESQTDKIKSESAQPEGQTDKTESESTQPESQTDKTESESAQPESQTDKTKSDTTQPQELKLGEEVKSKVPSPSGEGTPVDVEEEEDEDEDIPPFPDTLEGFGYHFEGGQLRNIETGEGFVFEVKNGKKRFNQLHYEAIGEVITQEVYKLLETEAGLKKVRIPDSAKKESSFFFASDNAQTADKLMVLIHGSGVVRAGQWARSLIINDCLDSGTQLPYIREAMKEGYGVVVTNTNENSRMHKGKQKQYKESGTPEQHAQYVWKHFVKKAKATHIDIVAHSYGGVVAVDLTRTFFSDFKNRVRKIAFTDSVHSFNPVRIPHSVWAWLRQRTVNWVSSDEPLDSDLHPWDDGIPRLSAGTVKHVETSWKSFESVFKFFVPRRGEQLPAAHPDT